MQYTNRMKFQNWRIDTDGFLRVTARVLREGVFPYAKADLPADIQAQFHPDQNTIHQYIPATEFPASLTSLEGKPVIIVDHEWRDAENTTRDGLTVGNTAGTPCIEDGAILVDFLITDQDTIDKITSKELVEVSAGYDGDLVMGAGSFGEDVFDATQTNLRFNHVLLLPVGEGRCGYEVRIINQKEKTMGADGIVHLRMGNREYKFTNAEDAEEAKKMAKDEASEATKGFDMEAVKNAMDEMPGLKDQLAGHQSVIDELKAKIAELEDPEAQEAAATELLEQAESEEAVKATDVDEKDKEEVTNSMKGCNRKDRVKVLMTHVLNKKGMDAASLDDAQIHALFQFHALNSKKALAAAEEAKKKGFVPGAHIGNREEPTVNKFFAKRFGNKEAK